MPPPGITDDDDETRAWEKFRSAILTRLADPTELNEERVQRARERFLAVVERNEQAKRRQVA